jgi:hypothetical protein
MTVGVTSHGRAYAYCNACGEFDTRDSRETAQRWLELHFNFAHAGFGCTSCAGRAQRHHPPDPMGTRQRSRHTTTREETN